MGCSGSKPIPGGNSPWERDTAEVRRLCGSETDPQKIALICARHNRPFVDIGFPPCAASLGPATDTADWARPQEILGSGRQPVLYDKTIEPNDVCQGALGDCWIICVFAILAQHPSMIRRICPVQHSDIDHGIFRLRLCKDGWWEWVTIDSYFPVTKDKELKFGRCRSDEEFWVPVMEKAYARLFGSYQALHGGNPPAALATLTGCAYTTLWLQERSLDEVFDALQLAFGMFYLVTAATKGKDTSSYVKDNHSKEQLAYAAYCDKVGIVAGHAYSVLRVANYKGTKLVRLRNPWGCKEWNGEWSDSSPLWTADAKTQLSFQAADDGSFWMPMSEFMQLYSSASITRFREDGTVNDWTDMRVRGMVSNQRPNLFAQIFVEHDTDAEVDIYNQTVRLQDPAKEDNRTNIKVRVYGSKDGVRYELLTEDPKKHLYRFPAASTPYLVVPYQAGLQAKHNNQLFTIVVTTRESTTRMKTVELGASLHASAVAGSTMTVNSVESLNRISVPMQRNGIPPPTANWATPFIKCPSPSEGEALPCLAATCVPCCLGAVLRSRYDDSNICLNLMCLTLPLLRNIVREGYSIEGSCVSDVCGSLCYPCALMQVHRELRSKARRAQVAQAKGGKRREMYTSCYSVDHCGLPCMVSCCCPPISNARTRSNYDGSNCCFNLLCVCGPMTRNIIREGYVLEGNCLQDIVCSVCFAPCAANQLRQEVDIRGPKSQQDVEQLAVTVTEARVEPIKPKEMGAK